MLDREVRDFATVQRWSVVMSIQRQSMAEHAAMVAIYAGQIADYLEWKGDRGALLQYALWHDAIETASGDAPGPYKRLAGISTGSEAHTNLLWRLFPGGEWSVPGDKVLVAIVKLADYLDELFWLLTERRLGNTTLADTATESLFRVQRAWGILRDGLDIGAGAALDDLWSEIMKAVRDHREGQFRTLSEVA